MIADTKKSFIPNNRNDILPMAVGDRRHGSFPVARQMEVEMAKPIKNSEPQFSVDDVKKFLAWMRQHPDQMQVAILSDDRMAVRILKNLKHGRDPGFGGPQYRPA